ncbi:protein FAM83B-like [Chaetodon trifascialis]|uniref:protein FAM83B-like n=1 Tax=Chaetodon trifascialis TaxID=109706 RepID=UPI003996A20B
MESSLSYLSSLKEEEHPLYIQPHYKETYRLAIYALLCGGKEAYEEFLHSEQISYFLSEEEILFILENAELSFVEDDSEQKQVKDVVSPSTYFPTESDEEVPDLDLGWPEVLLESMDTSISMLFHPPRQNTPSIKEVVRKQIQEARQVIAIAMDVFTDVDIFKEIVTATMRGVAVYILLDDSHFKSFLTMSHRMGVNIQDLKNLRVRTVQGQQYRCQSGVKFNGDLAQKFILVDCRTVLYGTYSYTWSFEKINLSMVLVITGQLVCSYDEEFRRLFARSTVPPIQSRERASVQNLRDLQSPNSSHLSLHQIHMRSREIHGLRGAQDDRFNNSGMLTRGLSMQDRLHQSHCSDMGNLMRGHSYGGELQKLSSLTRLRMGTKDIGASLTPERTGSNLRGTGDSLSNRLSQQHLRHQTLYGADQNLIPFNSESSLHRWKMETYLSMPLDASCDVTSPVISPYSSLTGLNEQQSQMIHSRSRDIKSRMEEMRQKRLSLQDFTNLRQSQESLRSAYVTERPSFMSSLRGLDKSVAELQPNTQNGYSLETANHKHSDPNKEGILTDGHRSASHYDVKMMAERKTTHNWHEPISRTTSAGDLNMRLNDPSLKLPHLQSSGLSIQQSRPMESLIEIPEEKEGSNTRVSTSDFTVFKDGNEEIHRDDRVVLKENWRLPAESQHQDHTRGSHASIGNIANSSGSPVPGGQKSILNETQTLPNTSMGTQHAVDDNSHTEKGQTQCEEPSLQRKNSMRMKVYSLLTSDDKKASKKEEKSVQRRSSLKSTNPSGFFTDHSQASVTDQPTETDKPKSPFLRLSSQRSSKKKANLPADQDRGSGGTLNEEGPTVYQRQKVYSRFEYFLNTDNIPKDKGSSLNKPHSGYPMHQTQSGTENKLGRFMQRVGNLIGKNK